MYARDMRFKTAKYRDWQAHAFWELAKPEPEAAMAALREAFDADKYAFHVTLTCYYPTKEFFNKQKGTISTRTIDVSNFEKNILDCMFGQEFHGSMAPYGCNNINANDKYIVQLISKKEAWENSTFAIKVEIELVEAPKL